MFEQILQAVKEHISNDPHLSAAIPADQQDAVHEAIATHVHETIQGQGNAPAQEASSGLGLGNLGGLGNMAGGFLSNIENSLASGGVGTSAITGGLVGALTGKLGLSPAITGAIAAALPGILQKLTQKNNPAN